MLWFIHKTIIATPQFFHLKLASFLLAAVENLFDGIIKLGLREGGFKLNSMKN
jgi:hypothetical protein